MSDNQIEHWKKGQKPWLFTGIFQGWTSAQFFRPGLFHKPRIGSPSTNHQLSFSWFNCTVAMGHSLEHFNIPPCQVWDKTCRIFVGESNYPSHRSRWLMVEGFNFLERWWWWLVDVFFVACFWHGCCGWNSWRFKLSFSWLMSTPLEP